MQWTRWLVVTVAAAVIALAALGDDASRAQPAGDAKPLEPAQGLTYLVVNKNSGRCLSVADGSVNPGTRIVQGPKPETAGASERWTLLGAGPAFRLRNHKSHLVLEIGSANAAPGVQAIQWHDTSTGRHQLWTFERDVDRYRLRVGHADFVLCVQEGSTDAGARVIQWQENAVVPDQLWELRPAFQEIHRSFQGKVAPDEFALAGPDVAECVKFEADGLRITLPVGHPDHTFRSIGKKLVVKGDFEITMGYEILNEPAPADTGLGSGVFLAVDLQTERNRATFTRDMRGRATFTSWFELTKAGDDKPFKTELKSLPTTARAGQLRLTRIGADLRYEVATAAAPDFTLIQRFDFSDEDVEQIRIGGGTGGLKASLDARVIDLRIRALKLPGVSRPGASGAAPEDAAPPRGSRAWFFVAGFLGASLIVLFAIAVVGWLMWRRQLVSRPMTEAKASEAEPVDPVVSFACPRCDKKLKVKRKLAGRKFKCPQCSHTIAVPAVPAPPVG